MYFEEIEKDLLEAAEEVENKYQEFFRKKMAEYDIESPNELSYEDRKKFFDEIEKEWQQVKENEEVCEEEESLNEGFNDVYAELYNNLICPQVNKVGDIVSFPYDGYDTDFEIKLIVEPVKFGDCSKYHLKVVNGPHKDEEMIMTQDYVMENMNKTINEESEQEVIDILDELVKCEESEEDMIEVDEDLDKLLGLKEEVEEDDEEVEELEESIDFDVSNIDDEKLEKVLKMFLDKKAEDGEDYELTTSGRKLLLKVHNQKFTNDVKKLLKEAKEETASYTISFADMEDEKMINKTVKKSKDAFKAVLDIIEDFTYDDAEALEEFCPKAFELYRKGKLDNALKELTKNVTNRMDPSDGSEQYLYQIKLGSKVLYSDDYWKGYPNKGVWANEGW